MKEAQDYSQIQQPENVIPSGTFYAAETPEQVAAMLAAMRNGQEIALQYPEVADLYRNTPLTYFQIAENFFPDLAIENPMLASKSVGCAVRSLIPQEELEIITKQRRARQLKENMGDFESHQSAAAKARHAQGIPVDTESMIRARGRTPWIEDEKAMVLTMINNPVFQIAEGQWKGRPNYAAIAEFINSNYHDGENIRYANSVASLVRDSRRKKDK